MAEGRRPTRVMVPASQQAEIVRALHELNEKRAEAIAKARLMPSISFPDFCRAGMIRSDDPTTPGAAPWQAWPMLVELAESWGARESQVILKARQLGISWLIAFLAAWKGRQGVQVGMISAGQRESRELLRRVAYVERHLPKAMRVPIIVNVDEIRYPSSDGMVMAFPSTESAGISYTFGLAVMDEAAFHPWGSANYTALRPTLSAGGQFIALSTADPALGPSGFFHDLYWDSKAGRTGYSAVFLPWFGRPGRDSVWLAREKAAFSGMPDEFDAYYPTTDDAAFVARSGLVYPQFLHSRHVRPAPFRIGDARRIVAGIDFGGGDPTAIVVLGLSATHHVHQFAEFYKKGSVGVDQLVAFLGAWNVDTVVCDPSEPVAIATLQGAGINAIPADNRRGEGLGSVAFLLDNDRLSIEPSLTNSIEEFRGYRWSERIDPNDREKYKTKTPVNNHADAMDARRYAVMELLNVLRPQPYLPSRSLAGFALATEAE